MNYYSYFCGLLTLPVLYLLVVSMQDTAALWYAVKKHGGENPRTLTRFGKIIVRIFQLLQGKPPEEFRRNRLPPPSSPSA